MHKSSWNVRSTRRGHSRGLYCKVRSKRDDSTVWIGFFKGFQVLFMILCECKSAAHTNILLHVRMSRFTHSMFHFKGFCVNSLSLLMCVMNNWNGSTYIGIVHQDFQCFDTSRGLGDGERPVISTARLFLQHDQIMTFDWMWTAKWLYKRETVRVGWHHKMCHVIRWGVLYSLFTF